MPVPTPTDKRFRRARVTPARRSRAIRLSPKRTVVAAMLIGLVVYVGYRAMRFVLTAEALTVTRISISGNSRISNGEVLGLLDGLHGASMITLDLEAWRRKLLTSPWVADAAMRRVLPGTITVAVSERQPMGIGRIGSVLYLIDQGGGIIDQFGPQYAEFDLPIIDGLAASPGDDATLIDEAHADLAVRLLTSLRSRPDLAKRVSEVDVTDLRDAVVLLKGDTALARVGNEQFAERLQSYVDLGAALREQVAAIDYVDLRFDERVYVRPKGGRAGVPVVTGDVTRRPRSARRIRQ